MPLAQHQFVFPTQRIHAMVLSSPRSPVTVFSPWALMISRCLLIAKPRETHLHIIGMCFDCPLTVYKVRLQCVASVNVWYKVLCRAGYDTRLCYWIGYIAFQCSHAVQVGMHLLFLMFSGFLPNIQWNDENKVSITILVDLKTWCGPSSKTWSVVFDDGDSFYFVISLQVENGWERNKHRVRSTLQPCGGEPVDQ